MRSPFAFLRDFWNKTKPELDDDAVPNRAAFRAMGIRGRRGASLVKQRVGPTLDIDAHDEYRWLGPRVGKFTRPRLGRSLPWVSHQQAYFLKTMRREAGLIQRHRWTMQKIKNRREAEGIVEYGRPAQV